MRATRPIIVALGCGLALASPAAPAAPKTHARNVILFIGDGMALPTVPAARILEGRQGGRTGEETRLSFERFPATATLSGVQTRGAVVGVDEIPARGDCDDRSLRHETVGLVERAKDAGLAVGVVTTGRITGGVAAAVYAHVSDRNWEVDSRMPQAAIDQGCRDIARQLAEFDHHGGLDVVLGGGRLAFMTPGQPDPQQPQRRGVRADGVDMIGRWKVRNPQGRYLFTARQLQDAVGERAGPVLGLFAPDAMESEVDRAPDAPEQPSLTAMTRAAVTMLSRQGGGYLLVVGQHNIDSARHDGAAARALADIIELSLAVQAATDMTRADDTLIVVTGDLANADHVQRAATPMTAETHSGEGAPVYARGPGAQRVRGVIGQTDLYGILAAALWPARR